MRDDPAAIVLAERARDGDQRAWDQIVERYAPLVWSLCRRLLSMTLSDPPSRYAKISAALSVPTGSIGPQRARCLDRLRRSPHLTTFSERETHDNEAKDARISDAGGGQRA